MFFYYKKNAVYINAKNVKTVIHFNFVIYSLNQTTSLTKISQSYVAAK